MEVTDSFTIRFRLHPESRVCDACGRELFTAATIGRNESTAVVDGYSRHSSHDGAYRATAAEQGQAVCLVRHDQAAGTLSEIFQAVERHLAFCVIPESMGAAGMADLAEGALSGASEYGVVGHDPIGNADACADSRRHVLETADLPQFQCLSSGSSGFARRIQRSHLSWIGSFKVNASQMQIGVQDSYALVGNLTHSLPLYAALEACYLGADVQLLSELRPASQLAAIDSLGTTVLYVTPTQARMLCMAERTDSRQIRGVRHVLCGGGKLDVKTRKTLQGLFSEASITEFYGASETSFITMSHAETPSGSVGRAYPGVELKVLDDNRQATTKVGEIWVRSDYLFTDYTQGGWRDTRLLDGFLSIGEMGQMDAEGNLFLSGRKSRLANVADTTVFLEEIENVLLQHVAVDHCVVVSQQDKMRGETLVAIVEGNDDDALRKELLTYARQQLGATLAPRDILFLETLPTLAAGKPDIREIQRRVNAS